MSDKAILRIAKHNSRRALRGALVHNLRVADTPNADASLRGSNQVPKEMNSIEKCMGLYDARLGAHKPRKNAIHSFEVVVTGSPEKMAEMSAQERTAYFSDSLKWLAGEFGGKANLVSVVVHNDETTPHMQAIFIPMHDGRLSYKKYLGGHRNRLSQLQSQFADTVGLKHGLTRGKQGSKATHKTIKSYYRDTQELPQLHAEIAAAEKKLADLNASVGNTLKHAQERLSAIIEPLIDDLSRCIASINPERTWAIKSALAKIDEIKPDLPVDAVEKIEQATRELDVTPRPKRR